MVGSFGRTAVWACHGVGSPKRLMISAASGSSRRCFKYGIHASIDLVTPVWGGRRV